MNVQYNVRNMDNRKVQKTASGSYIVTLPRPWVNSKAVESVNVIEENNGSLHLTPQNIEGRRDLECFLRLEDYPEPTLLGNRIYNCYMQGYDIIHLISKSLIGGKWRKVIRDSINDLIGVEISEERHNQTILRVLVEPEKFPLRELVKRVYSLASSMHEDAIESLRDMDMDLANDVIYRGTGANRLYRLVIRQLSYTIERGHVPQPPCVHNIRDCVIMALMARDLNRMVYYAKEIATQVIFLKSKSIDEDLKEMIYKISDYVLDVQKRSMRAYFSNDFALANEIIDMLPEMKKIHERVDKEIVKIASDAHTTVLLTRITSDIKGIGGYAIQLAYNTQNKVHPPVPEDE